MTALEKYVKERIPLKGHDRVRYEMHIKAKEMVERFHPNESQESKERYESYYLLGMWDAIEIVYS